MNLVGSGQHITPSASKTLNVARSESDLEELASSRCTLSLLVGESVDGSGRFSRSSSPDCRARCPQKLVGRGRSFRPDGRMRTPSRIADTNIMSHLTPHNLLTYCEQNKSPRVSRGDRGKRSPTDPYNATEKPLLALQPEKSSKKESLKISDS